MLSFEFGRYRIRARILAKPRKKWKMRKSEVQKVRGLASSQNVPYLDIASSNPVASERPPLQWVSSATDYMDRRSITLYVQSELRFYRNS